MEIKANQTDLAAKLNLRKVLLHKRSKITQILFNFIIKHLEIVNKTHFSGNLYSYLDKKAYFLLKVRLVFKILKNFLLA